jgi:dihydroxy-acid dehydratase
MTVRLRSKALSPDTPQYYMRRVFFKSMGATDADLEKPLVAIANTWNEVLPGSYHLDRVAAAVKRGVQEAGGMATIFNVLAPCDGQGSGNEGFKYVLPSRDLIAASVEVMIEHASYDAAVMIGTCDKIVPGLIMAAARCNLPTVLFTGGYMPAGHYKGDRLDCSSMGKYFVMYRQGKITKEELREVEGAVCPGPGACCLMGTANSMCIAAEAFGLSLPGNSALCATDPALEKLAEEAGRKVMELLWKEIKARDIMTPAAFRNSVKVCCATSGSTNLTLHFPAIAHELDYPFTLDDFENISRQTPSIMEIKPSDPRYLMEDFERAGDRKPSRHKRDDRKRPIPGRQFEGRCNQGPGDYPTLVQSKGQEWRHCHPEGQYGHGSGKADSGATGNAETPGTCEDFCPGGGLCRCPARRQGQPRRGAGHPV